MEKQLEHYLYEHIPISQAMGIKVEKASEEQVILKASFTSNVNHQKTVFGGSLNAVATLACWGLLYIHLKDENNQPVQIVITQSEIFYLAPVDADFKAICLMPDNDPWKRFLHTLRSKGKARILLSAKIFHHNQLAVDYKGTFAAIQPDFSKTKR